MKNLSDLSQEQLRYLHQKLSAEVIEFTREKNRAQSRLNKRMEKQDLDKADIEALKVNLTDAEALLGHLQSTNAPANLIEVQENVKQELQMQYEDEVSGLNAITDEEAFMQQLAIDELVQRKGLREAKITELDALIV